MIRPASAGGMPAAEFAAGAESAPAASPMPDAPSVTDAAAARGAQEPMGKLYELLGRPSHRQSFYADKGGGSGQGGSGWQFIAGKTGAAVFTGLEYPF